MANILVTIEEEHLDKDTLHTWMDGFDDIIESIVSHCNMDSDLVAGNYPWIYSVDPYGYSYFNYKQVEFLTKDIQKAIKDGAVDTQLAESFLQFLEDKYEDGNIVKFWGV